MEITNKDDHGYEPQSKRWERFAAICLVLI
jgi:hypothetical protein